MRTTCFICAIALLSVAGPAWSCEKDLVSTMKKTYVADRNKPVIREFEIRISRDELLKSPRWVPGNGDLALSPEEAFEVASKYIRQHFTRLEEIRLKDISLRGCAGEDGFRYYQMEFAQLPLFAVLFDGTVVVAKLKADIF